MNSYNAWLLSEYVPKNVLMYQVSITITMDRLTAVSANLKVSSKRKLRLAVSANGKLLCSVSVPDKFLWQGVNEKFKQVSRRGSPPILSQSQHVFGKQPSVIWIRGVVKFTIARRFKTMEMHNESNKLLAWKSVQYFPEFWLKIGSFITFQWIWNAGIVLNIDYSPWGQRYKKNSSSAF